MMQSKVIGVISKPPHLRKGGEVRAVLPWLRKKSEILSQSNDGWLLLYMYMYTSFIIFAFLNIN